MEKFNTHQVTMGIKKLIKQQNLKQKKDIAPNPKAFRSWFLRKVIDNDKNNSLNIWILNNPKIWGTHLHRREGVMPTTAAMPVVASRAHVFYPPTTRSTMKQDCFSLWKIAYFCIPGQLSIADSMDTVKISKRFAWANELSKWQFGKSE